MFSHMTARWVGVALAALAASWHSTTMAGEPKYRLKDFSAKIYDVQTVIGDASNLPGFFSIEETRGDWVLVRMTSGKAGWMQKANLESLDDALASATRLIKEDDQNVLAYWERARLTVERDGDAGIDAALADYNTILKIRPAAPLTLLARGTIYQFRGELDKALADFDRLLELDERFVPALLGRAQVFTDQQKWDAALADLDQAERILPAPSAEVSFLRGTIGVSREEWRKALADFQAALKAEPTHVKSLIGRAFVLCAAPTDEVRQGKEALASATKACELTRWKDPGALQVLAAAQAELGQFEEARKLQQQAMEIMLPDKATKKPALHEAVDRLNLYKNNQPYRAVK